MREVEMVAVFKTDREYGVGNLEPCEYRDEIVRCIKCRHCKETGGHANCNGWLTCTKHNRGFSVNEDDFCSWGERSE